MITHNVCGYKVNGFPFKYYKVMGEWHLLFVVVDVDGDEHIWKFDDRKKVEAPEPWVWQLPDNAFEDDGMFVHDHIDWYIDKLYSSLEVLT